MDKRIGNTPASFRDLTGQRFGRLTVIKRGENDKNRKVRWYCKCDCGNKKLVYKDALLQGRTLSCGCLSKEKSTQACISRRKTNEYKLSNSYGIGITYNTNNEFYFDLEDFDKIKNYCWRELNTGYIGTNVGRSILLLHRLVMNVEDELVDVDHIHHNVKDNRKSQLRITQHIDNLKNHKINTNNTSGVSGVSWNKKEQRWESYININKKRIRLGYYINFDEAKQSRLNAEKIYFGEYSFNNTISNNEDEDLF